MKDPRASAAGLVFDALISCCRLLWKVIWGTIKLFLSCMHVLHLAVMHSEEKKRREHPYTQNWVPVPGQTGTEYAARSQAAADGHEVAGSPPPYRQGSGLASAPDKEPSRPSVSWYRS